MSVRPRALLRDPLHFLALGGGSGLTPRLPGAGDAPPHRPSLMSAPARALLRDPLHFLALGGGSGLTPRLPGAAGTLVAALLCRQLLRDLPLRRRIHCR